MFSLVKKNQSSGWSYDSFLIGEKLSSLRFDWLVVC